MASPDGTSPALSRITVVVKNPANHGSADYTTTVPASFTVGDLKRKIASELEGNPPPSTQRLIYSGALLRDDEQSLLATLGSADVSAPAVFHLVTSHSNASTPSTSEAKRRDPATKRPGPSRADASPNPPLPNPVDSPPPSASSSRSAPRFVRDGTPGTMPGARGGGTPNTPGFSATPDARDPLARAAYSAAYAAAFATLSPGTPVPTPPGTSGGQVGVFGFSERANAVLPWFGGGQAPAPAPAPAQSAPGARDAPRLTGADAGLPPGWRELVCDGAVYYWDTRTGATTYARPDDAWAPDDREGAGDERANGERGALSVARDGARDEALVERIDGVGPEAAAQVRAAIRAIRDGDPARAAAAAAAAAAGGRPVRVVQFHVDLKLLMKLATLVCFVGQGASRERLAAYALAAAFAYAAQVGAFNGIARRALGENARAAGVGEGNQRDGVGEGNPRDPRGGVAAARAAAGLPPLAPAGPRTAALLPGMREGMPRTWLGEVKVALGGLLASLLPSWEPPELHRHPRERPPERPPERPHAD